MSIDNIALGNAAYKHGMTEDEIKTKNPQFRTGWRNAKKQFESKNTPISALRPERIEKPNREWVLSYPDVTAISMFDEWNILVNIKELEPIALKIRTELLDDRENIPSFKVAIELYRKKWHEILQMGFDEKILTEKDLQKFKFKPTK